MWWIRLALVANVQAVPDETRDSVKTVQCRAAAEIIRDVVLPATRMAKRRTVFGQSNLIIARVELEQHFKDNPPAPPASLLSKLTDYVHQNAVSSCAEVRSLLEQQQVRFDKRAVEAGRRLRRSLESHAVVYTMSLPALSADGRQALFGQSVFCGARCASEDLVHVSRNQEGRWVQVRKHFLRVS